MALGPTGTSRFTVDIVTSFLAALDFMHPDGAESQSSLHVTTGDGHTTTPTVGQRCCDDAWRTSVVRLSMVGVDAMLTLDPRVNRRNAHLISAATRAGRSPGAWDRLSGSKNVAPARLLQKESYMGQEAPADLCEKPLRPTIELVGLSLTVMTSGIGKIDTVSF